MCGAGAALWAADHVIDRAKAQFTAPNAQTVAPLPREVALITRADGVRLAFDVEVAATAQSRGRGLMFRQELAPNAGMLFVWPTASERAFWMRNTLIPLDIIFIDAEGRILRIHAEARPLDETPIPSHGRARSVLEIAGGRAAELGLRPGDRLQSPALEPDWRPATP